MRFGKYSIVKILFFCDSIDEEDVFEPETYNHYSSWKLNNQLAECKKKIPGKMRFPENLLPSLIEMSQLYNVS